MNPYPLFLNLENKKVAVFGGGKVAARKIKALLRAGANVKVQSLDYSPKILKLVQRKSKKSSLTLSLSPVNGGEGGGRGKSKTSVVSLLLKDADLVFAATSDRFFNEKVAAACKKRKIWVNVADRPELCDFFVPSHLKRGALEVAVSTNGASPLAARRFRAELSARIRPEAVRLLRQMKRLRRRAFRTVRSPAKRRQWFKAKIRKNFHFLY